tara:strand:- start:2277 stop:2717 length:441 start_codon:yes stop_codon:yes gene_type:complete
MAKVLEIAISKNFKGKMITTAKAQAVAKKGLVNDRHYKDNNDKKCQVTLIEIENIEDYNLRFGTSIPPINFRRNIITKGIKLNELIGKEFDIGKVKVKGHDLCRPCISLQTTLGKENVIKEFLRKGGLRCEILIGGIISVGDKIKI